MNNLPSFSQSGFQVLLCPWTNPETQAAHSVGKAELLASFFYFVPTVQRVEKIITVNTGHPLLSRNSTRRADIFTFYTFTALGFGNRCACFQLCVS
jgi:hypothetical protein